MYKLIYSSICFNKPAKCKLANMIRAAAITSRQKDVTGCITEYENGYLHYLEGPKESVQNVFAAISCSHGQHATIIHTTDNVERSFERHHIVGIELAAHLSHYAQQRTKKNPVEQLYSIAHNPDINVRFFGTLVKEALLENEAG